MTDNITGLDLQVAKGCDNNGHFDIKTLHQVIKYLS